MSDLIKRMRKHVASYKTLTRHRQDCLGLCDEIERLEAQLEVKTHQHKRDLTEYNRVAARAEALEGVREHASHMLVGGGEEAVYRLRGALQDVDDLPAATEKEGE